jgi:transcriptional regulator with XRE-family HTH domain
VSTFGQTIRNIRLARGYTRQAFAAALKERPQSITAWELGQRVPRPGTGPMIALRLLLGPALGDRLRDLAREERRSVTFNCQGRDEWERGALSVFQRLWDGELIDESVCRALQRCEGRVELPQDDHEHECE